MSVELYQGDCLEWMRGQPADRFDLVFGSPPYLFTRTYGIAKQDRWWDSYDDYLDRMIAISLAAAHICRGPVIWVIGCPTRKRNYHPVAEAIQVRWFELGGQCHAYRPCFYHRVGIPGSGGDQWFRSDTEFILCLKRPGALPWSDNTASGHPPKWAPGGEMSHRLSDGQRRNQWGGSYPPDSQSNARTKSGKRTKKFRPSHRMHTKARADGEMEVQGYTPPVLANPGNVFWIPVGGGLMGDPLAHENEAPMPEKLAEIFIRSCCPEDGWVLDPFLGSGTTVAVAYKWGRNSVGVDIRQSQIEICRKRVAQKLLI